MTEELLNPAHWNVTGLIFWIIVCGAAVAAVGRYLLRLRNVLPGVIFSTVTLLVIYYLTHRD